MSLRHLRRDTTTHTIATVKRRRPSQLGRVRNSALDTPEPAKPLPKLARGQRKRTGVSPRRLFNDCMKG